MRYGHPDTHPRPMQDPTWPRVEIPDTMRRNTLKPGDMPLRGCGDPERVPPATRQGPRQDPGLDPARDPGLSRFFFRSVEIVFSRAKFQARLSGNLAGPRKKQARHPGRWPRLDSAPSRFFFRGPRNFKPGGLEIWPAAGRSGSAYKGFPIGEPPAGLSAAKKKNKLGPRAAWPCEKKILTGQPTTGPAKKKQARLLPAGRSSTQPLSRFFFAKNHARRKFGTDLGSLLAMP